MVNGVSAGQVLGGGVDYLLIKDAGKPSGISSGVTIQVGLTAKAPVPFEVHSQLAGGGIIGFNLYDGLISVCDWILGG